MEEALRSGVTPRVFTTRPRRPQEGRTFVWAKTKWYERVEASSGAVEFVHVADSEPDLHRWLAGSERIDPTRLAEVDVDHEYGATVIQEFDDVAPLYPEAPEASDEAPFEERLSDVEEASGFHREP